MLKHWKLKFQCRHRVADNDPLNVNYKSIERLLLLLVQNGFDARVRALTPPALTTLFIFYY